MEENKEKKKIIKILSIEDDEFMRIFLKDVFWMHGAEFNFRIVDNFNHAKELIKNPETKPDLLLLDLRLPEEAGEKPSINNALNFLENFKLDSKTKNIKVIVFSGYGDREIKAKALKLGAEKFLLKGKHLPQELIKVIREAFNR